MWIPKDSNNPTPLVCLLQPTRPLFRAGSVHYWWFLSIHVPYFWHLQRLGSLHCTFSLILTASLITLSRAHCLIPEAFLWNGNRNFHDPAILAFSMPEKQAWMTRSELTANSAATNPSVTAIAAVSESLDGWTWRDTLLGSPEKVEWPQGLFSK